MQGRHGLFDRRVGIGRVTLVHVDVVGSEAAKAVFQRSGQVLAAKTPVVRTLADRPEALGGQHDLVALGVDSPSNHLFGLTAGVAIGGVNKVAAVTEERVDDATSLFLVGRGGRAVAEHHGSEAGPRDVQARAAEGQVFHLRLFLCIWVDRSAVGLESEAKGARCPKYPVGDVSARSPPWLILRLAPLPARAFFRKRTEGESRCG